MTKKETPSAQRPDAMCCGHVVFVGSGPGDPDLLTIKALKAIQSGDVIIHDRLVPASIVALASDGATVLDVGKEGFGPSTPQATIDALIVEHSLRGARVIRLKGGDATVFGRLDEEIDALEAVGITYEIVPGITAASAALASIGQSFTKRGRNRAARILTGHAMEGFADQDWRSLAQPDEVAAIYMGKKAARFIQGRLMMHGANGDTPVTVVANAARPNQRIVGTTLSLLVQTLSEENLDGPVLLLLGLAPRDAQTTTLLQQEFA